MMNIDEKYVKEYLMNNILGNLIADRLYTGSFAFVCDNARGAHPKLFIIHARRRTKHPKSTMNWRSKKLKIRTSTLNNI